MTLHMIKLVVGADSIEALLQWRADHQHLDPDWKVHTRQTPKRADELVDGGSIYRVIKGVIQCRQRILRIETVGEGQAARCHIVVSPEIIRTAPAPRRPFQGWRYLEPKDAPQDLHGEGGDDAIPTELALKLRELGAW
ncbi:MAG TPA: DUF1489 domain-containing protein [Caulobacteraceae bacterium]|jgi:hypothetical protein|nr:DUF1489 domain-containing protein [Caulobacteraceae bacterium]